MSEQEEDRELRSLLLDFAKYVSLQSMYANEKITNFYQLDNKADIDVSEMLERVIRRIAQKQREARQSELKFLERLKLEFDANIAMSAGEKWSESDAAELLKKRLAELTTLKENPNV